MSGSKRQQQSSSSSSKKNTAKPQAVATKQSNSRSPKTDQVQKKLSKRVQHEQRLEFDPSYDQIAWLFSDRFNFLKHNSQVSERPYSKDLNERSVHVEQMRDQSLEYRGSSDASRTKKLENSNGESYKIQNSNSLPYQPLQSLRLRAKNAEHSRNLLWLLILSSGMMRSSSKQWISMHGISKEQIHFIQRHCSSSSMLQLQSGFESPVGNSNSLRRFIRVEPGIGFRVCSIDKLKEAIGWRKHVIDTG